MRNPRAHLGRRCPLGWIFYVVFFHQLLIFECEICGQGNPDLPSSPPTLHPSAIARGNAVARERYVQQDRDNLGYFAQTPSFQVCAAAGAQVIDFTPEQSFAVLYRPTNYRSGRAMILLHGSNGTAYDEIKDELHAAQSHDYFLIALQWHDRKSNRYLTADQIHLLIGRSLHFVRARYGVDPRKVALCGFSRGAAVSFEVAWLDAQDQRNFRLVICHSGGIPREVRAPLRDESASPSFFARINQGELGSDSYRGCHFFLYSGDRDEQWGREMSYQMEHATKVVPQAGGVIVKWIRDPRGGHAGYRRRSEYHEEAIRAFILAASLPVAQ